MIKLGASGFEFPLVGDAVEIMHDYYRGRRFEILDIHEDAGRTWAVVWDPYPGCIGPDCYSKFPVTAVRPFVVA